MIEILLLAGLVVFVTHTLESVTGFGCTALAFPFVILLMKDLERAKIVLSIPRLCTCRLFCGRQIWIHLLETVWNHPPVCCLGFAGWNVDFQKFGCNYFEKSAGCFHNHLSSHSTV